MLLLPSIIAEKGNSFIDIIYGLTQEEAKEVYDLFFAIYTDDYYTLSCDGNYVYCISDENTFIVSGIADTASVGIQHITN